MIYILSKLSEPSWSTAFNTRHETTQALHEHICYLCREEAWDNAVIESVSSQFSPVVSISHLLNTQCGCEFHVEEYV
jgi:hypothetical protein